MTVYQLNRPEIATIISYCDTLAANEKLEVYEFGENCDLVLHIYKDENYNQKTGECNLVVIHTAKNGTFEGRWDEIVSITSANIIHNEEWRNHHVN